VDGRRQRALHTQQRLLIATLELSERHGFDQLTFNQIIAHAGSSSSTAYRHFGGKIGILRWGIEDALATFSAQFVTSPHRPIFDDLMARLKAWEDGRNLAQDLRIWRIVTQSEALIALHTQEVHRYEGVITGWLQQSDANALGADPDLLASLMLTARQHAVRAWLNDTPEQTARWPYIEQALAVLRPPFPPPSKP